MGKKFSLNVELTTSEMENYSKVEARMPDAEWFRKDVTFPDNIIMRIGAKNFTDPSRKMDFYCDLQRPDGSIAKGSFQQKENIFDGKWEVTDKSSGNKYSVQLEGPQRELKSNHDTKERSQKRDDEREL